MKYLKDPNSIVGEYTKFLLIHPNPYEAIAYLLGDILNELSIRIQGKNRLIVVGLFQDIFDTINPYAGNIFSAFDLEENNGGFEITFLQEFDDDGTHPTFLGQPKHPPVKVVY